MAGKELEIQEEAITVFDPDFGYLPVQGANPEALASIRNAQDRVRDLLAKSKAKNTRIAYRKAWDAYKEWCDRLGLPPLSGDPELVGMYMASIADKAPSTIRQRLAAIKMVHSRAGVPLDTQHYFIAGVVQGHARERGQRPQRQAAPVLPEMLRALLAATSDDACGRRDRALLLVWYGAALRRGEVAALHLKDVALTDKGVRLLIRFSKTDPAGEGEDVAIFGSTDPLIDIRRAHRQWLEVRGTAPGPLFRRLSRGGGITGHPLTGFGLTTILKRLCVRAGIDAEPFSGHSLRAGFATSAAIRGASLESIMKQTRHRSYDSARRYIRDAEIWERNASQMVFGDPADD